MMVKKKIENKTNRGRKKRGQKMKELMVGRTKRRRARGRHYSRDIPTSFRPDRASANFDWRSSAPLPRICL